MHNLDRVAAAKKDTAGWKAMVDRMIGKGTQLTDEKAQVIIAYLAETHK